MRPRIFVLCGVLVLVLHPRGAAGSSQEDTLAARPALRTLGVDSAMSASGSATGHSPALATLLSAAVPGAGQIYNRSYWKVPLVLGFGAYFTSQWLHYNRLTGDARDRYAESLLRTPGGNPTQLSLREFYKEQRDTYTWYLVILYVLNVADAFVDATLFDFDVGDDLSVRVLPVSPGRLAIQLAF